jgi:hypothetical protein
LGDALDALERTAGDGDVAADPVGSEILVGKFHEPVQLGRAAVQHMRGVDPSERRLERWQEAGIRVAVSEIPDVRG